MMRGSMPETCGPSIRSTTSGIRFRAEFGAECFQAVSGAVDQHDAGARRQHVPRAFETDAGCRAGDGGDLTFKGVQTFSETPMHVV